MHLAVACRCEHAALFGHVTRPQSSPNNFLLASYACGQWQHDKMLTLAAASINKVINDRDWINDWYRDMWSCFPLRNGHQHLHHRFQMSLFLLSKLKHKPWDFSSWNAVSSVSERLRSWKRSSVDGAAEKGCTLSMNMCELPLKRCKCTYFTLNPIQHF